MEKNFQFLIYRSAEEDVSVNAIVKDESIWLSQQGMAELLGVQKPAMKRASWMKKWLFPKWKQPLITGRWTIKRRRKKRISIILMPSSR